MDVGRMLCKVALHHWGVVRLAGIKPYVGCRRCLKEKQVQMSPTMFMGP